MTSEKRCCVPNCDSDRQILHKFPNPEKDPDRFRIWIYNIGGDILGLENDIIFKNRRVCHVHFETRYHTRYYHTRFLSADAVPRLCLTGLHPARGTTNQENRITPLIISPLQEIPPVQSTSNSKQRSCPLKDITNQENSSTPSCIVPIQETTSRNLPPVKSTSSKQQNITKKAWNKSILLKQIKKLQIKKDAYQIRLKKALKLATNNAFQSALRKFKTLAAIFTIMQFREISKLKMARRYTKEEKVMALSVYKMGPKAYRWLSKIFILPSSISLSRMISKAKLKPGINENIFQELKAKINKMSDDDKLCTLMFDEMALSPHFDYSQSKDQITGFVNYNGTASRKIADHVLVFMIRGVTRNYKQPIYYSFCSGSTPKEILVSQIKNVIKKLQSIGFNVLATVCDQSTSNTSALNYLVEETRTNYLRNKNLEYHNCHIFKIGDKDIIPLYDIPHLLKGIRNNLISKDLKFKMGDEIKVAKWSHIMKLYENNPTYKGLKIIKNLTENHCNSEKIPKMKVKYASQLFSQTVGKTMGYLAENGILPIETKDTADFIIFIDTLFDSLNGSMKNADARSGKELLRNVTPSSRHKDIWLQAKIILKSMTFITSRGSTGTVPTLINWIKTIENMIILSEKLFNIYSIKSFWCRHFNQDPLENFFGSIRSHGVRNISPTCAGFESAFASLLVNNLSRNYTPGSNCENDFCSMLQSFDDIFFSKDHNTFNKESLEIDSNDLNDEIIIDYDVKINNPIIVGQLEYVTGYILRKTKKKFSSCKKCKSMFNNNFTKNRYLQHREYFKHKKLLCYPSENMMKCFSEIQDILHHILKTKSHVNDIKIYMKTMLYIHIDTKFIECSIHSKDILEFMFEFSCKFYAHNWCKWTNKLLNGTSTTKDVDQGDDIHNQAIIYYIKRRRSKFQVSK